MNRKLLIPVFAVLLVWMIATGCIGDTAEKMC